ncbi:tubulin nucleotide-binding domain-like protein [Myriangium duriaei CBS 260.36]|uniref:Tubulin nucleotide-binding domain-like protein n=1 Tax=Myriangium duriaei CBS 260.36 TaxID=1168546 RepID=A0A9P4IV06_9PEZI|nr:tubulin nucleotide-binding domain-like protein [Myriangium duriaei CBS 260.36]
MHEIVTLQFGQQANYVATHFWNTQESYFTYGSDEESPVDHDIHFRPGVGADGSDTFTPRTVIYDLKGAFGTLRRDNALYQSEEDDGRNQQCKRPGQPQVIQQPAITPNEYQTHLDSGLDPPRLTTSSVRYWSDYNRVYYHPRSIVQLHEYELGSSIAPFERWSTGEELFSNLDREHDLLDKDLRPFLEEADHLQAVQVFANADDAWGGFSSKYLEAVRDELGKTGLWVWALEDGARKTREKQLLQSSNVIQSLYSLSSTASLYVPLTTVPVSLPDYITGFDTSSRWHTAALQMTAIETATLPSRLKNDQSARSRLDDFETILSNSGKRRIATMDLSLSNSNAAPNGDTAPHDDRMPGLNGHAHSGHDDSDTDLLELDIGFAPAVPSLDPSSRRGTAHRPTGAVFSQVQSLRGVFKSTLEITDVNQASRNKRSAAAARGVRIGCHQTSLLFPLQSSFPEIYSFGSGEGKVAARATLSASANVARDVRALLDLAPRIVGVEDREALVEGLSTLAEEYEEGWSGGESDDDDE